MTYPKTDDLAKLIFQDELTELYNRRYMYQYLKDQVDWKAVGKNSTFTSLLMIDVDFFKEINDNYGHLEGDNALKFLAGAIKKSVRKDDIAIRYAGDEFTVIMPATDKNSGCDIAEAIRKKVAGTVFRIKGGAKDLKLSISLGIACFPDDGRTPEELIDAADKALYISKKGGKNKVSIAGTKEEKAVVSEKELLKNFPPPVFINREKTISEIKDVFSSVKEGTNSFVLIAGEAGIGKSRFLKEITVLTGNEASAFYFTCLESEKRIPYKPLTYVLSKLINRYTEITNKFWSAASYLQQLELKRLIPVLPEVSALPESKETTDEARRKTLFEGLSVFLTEFSEKHSVVVGLDEMQNVDEGTLEIINYLNSSDRGRVMICGAIRSSILDVLEKKHPEIDSFLTDLSGTEWFKYVLIEALDQPNTSAYISALLANRSSDTAFDHKVFEVTKGNPLFIEEMVKNLILKKHIVPKANTWVVNIIPENAWHYTLESVIQDNFMLLDKTTMEMLSQASVGGLQIDLKLLKNLAGKNEGEILDLIDKAKSARLVGETKSFQSDLFNFLSQRIQEVTYENIDDSTKRNLHQQIGEATEKLHKDDIDAVASTLSYHYKQSGNKDRAELYAGKTDQMASQSFRHDEAKGYYEHGKMIIRSKIKEATDPLGEDLMKLMKDILRGVCATAKNMRLYPEGSQLIVQSSVGLIKTFETVLARADKITLSEIKNQLNVNTIPLDPKTYGTGVTDFLNLMREHYIKSCTIRHGVNAKEMELFLRDLDNSPNKNYAEPGYWNTFLDAKAITNIGIAQRAFVVTSPVGKSKSDKSTQKSGMEINAENTPVIRDYLRHLIAAIDNVRLYPEGSQLTTQAVQLLQDVLGKLFVSADAVDLSEVENNLLFNGTLLNSRTFGVPTQLLAKLIRENNIRSIGINRSYTAMELEKVLRLINNPPLGEQTKTEDWHMALTSQGVFGIVIGQSVYSVAEHKKSAWREKLTGKGEGVGEGSGEEKEAKEVPLDDQIIQLLKNAPEQLISAEFLEVANKLAQSQTLKQLIDLVDRFIENFKSNKPEVRARALSFFANSFERMSDPVKEYISSHATPFLVECIKSEQSPAGHAPLLQAFYQTVDFYLSVKNYEDAGSLVSALKRESGNIKNLDDKMKEERRKKIAEIIKAENFAGVINDLESPDPNIKTSALVFLSAFEELVTPLLMERLKASENIPEREILATLMRQSGESAVADFVTVMASATEPEDIKKLLSVINIISPPGIVEIIIPFVKHKDDAIRKEALGVIKKMPKEVSLPILAGLLKEAETLAMLSAGIIEELGYQEASDNLVEIFERVGDNNKIELLHVIGRLGSSTTVPFLTNILFKKKSFLGMGSGYSDTIRGAAAWALGHIKSLDAKAALEKALKDKSPEVSSAAKLGMRK
ncbi:MAG: diguanylate cyclase [Planctomycetes bacterium]|nr:diguanylate cyclase [Planctomycetota bacterium]